MHDSHDTRHKTQGARLLPLGSIISVKLIDAHSPFVYNRRTHALHGPLASTIYNTYCTSSSNVESRIYSDSAAHRSCSYIRLFAPRRGVGVCYRPLLMRVYTWLHALSYSPGVPEPRERERERSEQRRIEHISKPCTSTTTLASARYIYLLVVCIYLIALCSVR